MELRSEGPSIFSFWTSCSTGCIVGYWVNVYTVCPHLVSVASRSQKSLTGNFPSGRGCEHSLIAGSLKTSRPHPPPPPPVSVYFIQVSGTSCVASAHTIGGGSVTMSCGMARPSMALPLPLPFPYPSSLSQINRILKKTNLR